MICEKCKIREATIQYTEVINGNRREHHFCAQCAQEMNFGQQLSSLFDGDFPFSRILSALLGEESGKDGEDYANIVCPKCGTGYRDFLKGSRFGCPECYEIFDILIRDSIRQLQGSEQHKGKIPKYGLRAAPRTLAEELPGRMEAPQESGKAPGSEEGAERAGGGEKAREQTERAGMRPGESAGEGTPPAEQAPDSAQKLRELRRRMAQAARREDYENAARYRDEIRELEKEGKPDA